MEGFKSFLNFFFFFFVERTCWLFFLFHLIFTYVVCVGFLLFAWISGHDTHKLVFVASFNDCDRN